MGILEIILGKLAKPEPSEEPIQEDGEKRLEQLRAKLSEINAKLWDEIKFADAKAGGVFALSGIFTGGLFVTFSKDAPEVPKYLNYVKGFEILSVALFGFIALCALVTLMPRYKIHGNSTSEATLTETLKHLWPFDVTNRRGAALLNGQELSDKTKSPESWQEWPVQYENATQFKMALLMNFEIEEESVLLPSDRALIIDTRRLGVIADRKYRTIRCAYFLLILPVMVTVTLFALWLTAPHKKADDTPTPSETRMLKAFDQQIDLVMGEMKSLSNSMTFAGEQSAQNSAGISNLASSLMTVSESVEQLKNQWKDVKTEVNREHAEPPATKN